MANATLVDVEYTYEFKTKCPRCRHKTTITETWEDRVSVEDIDLCCPKCHLNYSEHVYFDNTLKRREA